MIATTPEKREVETTAYLWAPGESPWWSGPAQERVQIVPDKKTYQPGDTAHVLIVTGKEPASVLVTAEGNGLYSGQVIRSAGGSITVDVPIKPEYAPNFYVGAVFIRGNKLYQGSKSLTVPPTQHELKVQLLPSKPQYQPGEAASYTIKATDAGGKPVAGAEFSLGVVDEAIYAIKPDATPNIMNAFYGRIYSKVSTDTSLTYYFSGQAGKRAMPLANARPSRGLAQLKPERLVQPKVRKAFPDTAYWVADVNTGGNGQATVHFNYPDAITSWRATTRGVTQDTKVGGAVENTIVRKNLMVRLVVPRFFRRGDEIVVSTIVQNYLPTEKTARVSMEFDGLQVMEGATKDVNVPSRGLMKVDYRVRVLNVDSARVLGKALTDVESDAMELTLPVVPFGVKLAVAKSGSIAGPGTSDTVQTADLPGRRRVGHAQADHQRDAVCRGNGVRRSRIPYLVSLRLHRADHVKLPAGCAGRQCHAKAGRQVEHRPTNAQEAGAGRTRPALQLPASRWRLGLVAERRQPSLYDRIRARRIEPGEGRRVRREAGRH